jgi:DNA excision repair protein ERCC-2
MQLYFRHDEVRPHQKELMQDASKAIVDGRILMAQAVTGIGKTDSVLSAAISCAVEEKKTVFFLTPKISQHRIAMDVVRGISDSHSLNIKAVDMVGRAHCCINKELQDLDNDSFQTACGNRIKEKQCQPYINAKGYSRFHEALARQRFEKLLKKYGTGMHHHDLIKMGAKAKCCPYEWLIKLAEASDVIIGDYYHMMLPHIREIFLMKTKKRLEDSIIIIDEAHNLASRIRSSLSRSVNSFTFTRVHKEMQVLGLDAGPVEDEFQKWAAEVLGDSKEKPVAIKHFHEFIGRFGITMDEAADRLREAGISYVEQKGRKSACLWLAKFMYEWADDSFECVRILKQKDGRYFLSKRLLDPSAVTGVLNHCSASVLMSGSLMPLEMHRDILGLDKERTDMRSYPSPFDSDSIVNIITEELTTKYTKRDLENYTAIANKLDAVAEKTPGGTAVFFPSYGVMDNVLTLMKSNELHVQRPKMKPPEIRRLIKDFGSGGVLCAVQGGSLAEGIDFCKGEIKTAVIVGVALEEMDIEARALIDYYDQKFGRGWDYGYLYPGTIKALQAAGRARRKESDRVAVVYMDERFKWNKYNWILNRDERIVVTGSPEKEVETFWRGQSSTTKADITIKLPGMRK